MKFTKIIIYSTMALIIFAQGLYFDEQWLVALVLTCCMFLGICVKNKKIQWSKSLVGYFLMGYVLLHLMGYLFFVERGMLIFGLLKSCTYLVLYALLLQLSSAHKVVLSKAFVTMMAVAGVITSIIFVSGWSVGLKYVINNRAAGPLQYANTYGMLLIVALLFTLAMNMRIWTKGIVIVSLVIPLILTMSRGNFIIAVVMVTVFLILKKESMATIGLLITSIVIGLLMLKVFGLSEATARLSQGIGASEWQSRLLYYKDALKMIGDHPMGYGPNGYHYGQSFYQTGSTYHVKFVHSALLQFFLDFGVIGGLWFIAFIGTTIFFIKKPLVNQMILLTLLGHSLVDMNLQFPLVWLVLILTLTRTEVELFQLNFRESIGVYTWVVVIFIVGCGMLAPAFKYEAGDYRGAIEAYPFYTEAYRKLLKDSPYKKELVPYALELVRLNPYITEAYPTLKSHAIKSEKYQEALRYSKAMVTYSPILIEHHVQYSHALILAATYWHATGKDSLAVGALKEILQLPSQLEVLANSRHTDYNVKHKPKLQMNDALMKDYVEASYLMDKITDESFK